MTDMEQVIIAISGVDGSGKSTLASALRERIGPSRCIVLGTRFNPRTALGGWTSGRPTSNVRSDYRDSRVKSSMKAAWLGRGYAALAARLYARQLALQLAAVDRYPVLVADRFVADFLADLVRSSVIELDQAPRLRDRFPSPAAAVLVDTGDDTLRQRAMAKGDAPSLVVQRAMLYRNLADHLGLRTIDTQRTGVDDAVDCLLDEVRFP